MSNTEAYFETIITLTIEVNQTGKNLFGEVEYKCVTMPLFFERA